MALRSQLIALLSILLLLVAGAGCSTPQRNTPPPVAETKPQDERTEESGAKRFQDTPLEGRTAVESAIELSEKYARLSDQTVSLREENQRLVTENETLKRQITGLENKLQQTQRELTEANDLLIEMLTEINNWKTNVLGFRSEMREAARAQLEALLRVLEILGGEAEAGTLGRQHATTLNPEAYDVEEPNQSLASFQGEPNGLQ